MKWNAIFGIWLLLLFLWGCSSSETEDISIDFGYDYFLPETGQVRVYQLDSIFFFQGPGNQVGRDTQRYFVREEVTGSFTDDAGEESWRIEQAQRRTAGAPWQTVAVYQQGIKGTQLGFRTEGNRRFISLLFPLREKNSWDALRYFDKDVQQQISDKTMEPYKGWESSLNAVAVPYSLNGTTFMETALVQLADFENLIELRRGTERYAKGVGLIERELYILDSQCDFCCNGDSRSCDQIPWVERAEHGVIIHQQLLSF